MITGSFRALNCVAQHLNLLPPGRETTPSDLVCACIHFAFLASCSIPFRVFHPIHYSHFASFNPGSNPFCVFVTLIHFAFLHLYIVSVRILCTLHHSRSHFSHHTLLSFAFFIQSPTSFCVFTPFSSIISRFFTPSPFSFAFLPL